VIIWQFEPPSPPILVPVRDPKRNKIGEDENFVDTTKNGAVAGSFWREYAREAIIKLLLSYSMFMINIYFSCQNYINWKN
jgi:hypothetical protein